MFLRHELSVNTSADKNIFIIIFSKSYTEYFYSVVIYSEYVFEYFSKIYLECITVIQ